MPAMNDDVANTTSFSLATLMPIAAAARSFDRIASIRRPEALRMLATASANTSAPRRGRCRTPAATSRRRGPDRGPSPQLGFGTLAPPVDTSPTNVGFLKMNSASPLRPPASGSRDRCPGHERRDATITPKSMATSAARIGASGNGMSHWIANFDSENPATPANAICASDVCPPKPVNMTNDRASDRDDRGHDGAPPHRAEHDQAGDGRDTGTAH